MFMKSLLERIKNQHFPIFIKKNHLNFHFLFYKVSTTVLLAIHGVPSGNQKSSTKASPTNGFVFEYVSCAGSFWQKMVVDVANRCRRKKVVKCPELQEQPKTKAVVLQKTKSVKH